MTDTQATENFPVTTLPKESGLPVRENDGAIDFQGLRNTRDLGGLPTADGGAVRRGRLLRSGYLHGATSQDLQRLADEFDLRLVIDLRIHEEREEKPDPVKQLPQVSFCVEEVLTTSSLGITRETGLRGALRLLRQLKRDAEGLMCQMYRQMVLCEEGQAAYAGMFRHLLATPGGAVLWHCSGGKDRAGLASALVESALGVPEQAIMDDYLATNRHCLSNARESVDAVNLPLNLGKRFGDSLAVINSAKPQFLQAALTAIDEAYGSRDAYLTQALSVDADARRELRARYVE